ncbi:MAG: aldo/keto reductase [Treponema sp.]|jgi:predicted oxidoreductase|nr:aldo/keto reductase [Treponema sp.]
MRIIKVGPSGLQAPVIAVGCMRINTLTKSEAERFIKSALDMGACFFDHADIYGNGICETLFAEAVGMTPAVRETLQLQSKCGIRPGIGYDFSQAHILKSVEASLKRLKTEYLDVLLLHRPDALMEPEAVAEAFGILQSSGKVRHFGVSNQNALHIQLLQKYVKQPIVINQLQLSLAHANLISQGLQVNMGNDATARPDGSTLDFCRLKDITVQTWSPLQYGTFKGTFLGNPLFPKLNEKIDRIAEEYAVSPTTIALAWLLRHPAQLQPVTGTMQVERLKDCVQAADITLSREEWYELYLAAGNILP